MHTLEKICAISLGERASSISMRNKAKAIIIIIELTTDVLISRIVMPNVKPLEDNTTDNAPYGLNCSISGGKSSRIS